MYNLTMGIRKGREKEPMMKTSLSLPENLWRAAKIRALDERAELQEVIARALELYLKTKPRKEGER
jgi:hypothetical protein